MKTTFGEVKPTCREVEFTCNCQEVEFIFGDENLTFEELGLILL